MSDPTLIPPEKDKTPPSYGTEPARHVTFAELPPDVTLKPEGFALKRHIFVGSVTIMVLASFITFFMPLFNGLLGGVLGGYHAGRMKRALGAAAVCSVMVPAMIGFLAYMSQQPELFFLMGLTFWEWLGAHILGTFLGAVTGAIARPKVTERDLYSHA